MGPEIIALLGMAVAVSLGQMLIKAGSLRLSKGKGFFILIKSFFTLPMILGGIFAFSAPILYFYALSRIGLARAYGFTGLSYLFTTVLSRLIFKETVPVLHWMGVLLISAGVFVWNL